MLYSEPVVAVLQSDKLSTVIVAPHVNAGRYCYYFRYGLRVIVALTYCIHSFSLKILSFLMLFKTSPKSVMWDMYMLVS